MTTAQRRQTLNSLRNEILDLKTILHKQQYLKQCFIVNFHNSIRQFDESDYAETLEMLAAQAPQTVDDLQTGGISAL